MGYRETVQNEIAQKMREQAVAEARHWGLPDVDRALALIEELALVRPEYVNDALTPLYRKAVEFSTEHGGELP